MKNRYYQSVCSWNNPSKPNHAFGLTEKTIGKLKNINRANRNIHGQCIWRHFKQQNRLTEYQFVRLNDKCVWIQTGQYLHSQLLHINLPRMRRLISKTEEHQENISFRSPINGSYISRAVFHLFIYSELLILGATTSLLQEVVVDVGVSIRSFFTARYIKSSFILDFFRNAFFEMHQINLLFE